MSVKIRLARHGRKKRAFYRIVAANIESKRSGRFLEILGSLDPLVEPPALTLKQERVEYWLGVGAKPTDTAASLIERTIPGYLSKLEESRVNKIRSRRAARKQRMKKKG